MTSHAAGIVEDLRARTFAFENVCVRVCMRA
jgi:hypothetical protein